GFEPGERPDEPERHQNTKGREQGRNNAGKHERIQPGDAMQRNHWSTQGTEGYWSRIRKERQTRSLKRKKAQPHQDCAANRHRSSKARSAFKESSEDKGDQQQLKAAVLSDSDQAFLQEAKPAGTNGELVHKNDGEN